jgi:hypothetical protein
MYCQLTVLLLRLRFRLWYWTFGFARYFVVQNTKTQRYLYQKDIYTLAQRWFIDRRFIDRRFIDFYYVNRRYVDRLFIDLFNSLTFYNIYPP